MPLEETDRAKVIKYCDRDLPDRMHVLEMFKFVSSKELLNRIELEFHSARYIYKLGEALNVADEKQHAHVKFQIVQYASIYEAVIVYLLWNRYPDHAAVTEIEYHSTFKQHATLPKGLQMLSADNEEIFLCREVKQKTPKASIKFDDKVEAAVKIGFIEKALGDEIKRFYKLRNAIHLEGAVKNQTKYELDQSKLAFRRMKPFTEGISGFLENGAIPESALLKPEKRSLRGKKTK